MSVSAVSPKITPPYGKYRRLLTLLEVFPLYVVYNAQKSMPILHATNDNES
jgi:hypothetical protein